MGSPRQAGAAGRRQGDAATGGQGTGGRASINLHGLGTNRNLVLLDGRRLPVSDINGNVDIVSSPALLAKLVNLPSNLKFARIPSTWTDSLSY